MLKCLGCDERYVDEVALCARCNGKDFIYVSDAPPPRGTPFDGQTLAAISTLANVVLSMLIDRRVTVVGLVVGFGLLLRSERARSGAIILQWVAVAVAAVLCLLPEGRVLALLIALHAMVVLALLTEEGSPRRGLYGRIGLGFYWAALIGLLAYAVLTRDQR